MIEATATIRINETDDPVFPNRCRDSLALFGLLADACADHLRRWHGAPYSVSLDRGGLVADYPGFLPADLDGLEAAAVRLWELHAQAEERLRGAPAFRHQADPACSSGRWFRWSYVYLHGQAEQHNRAIARLLRWEEPDDETAADLFLCDRPMPAHVGSCSAVLYGREVVAVLTQLRGGPAGTLAGRAAFPSDTEGMAHASDPAQWG